MTRILGIFCLAGITLACSLFAQQPAAAPHPKLILVFVIDGLRPDSINDVDTPNLLRLQQEGVYYLNAHSAFPSVTRVNAAAISTGTYPGTNGLVSNSMFVPEVQSASPFSTSDYQKLLRLGEVSGGRLLFVKSLGERLHESGFRFAAVSSGSTGNALLLNPLAPQGIGVLINGNFDPGKRVAYPDDTSAGVLSRFGTAPREEATPLVDWTERVLREYLLPEVQPDVVIDWLTEPDSTQHEKGVGSKEAREALRNCDRNLGLLLQKLEDLGLKGKTDFVVLSDHGFSVHTYGVNITQELVKAKLKASTESDDVVVVSNGQSVLLHVKGRDQQRIHRIVRYLQDQPWVDVVFTAAQMPVVRNGKQDSPKSATHPSSRTRGWVDGTFSLELIHEANAERGPDILFTLPWTSAANPFGVSGTQYTTTNGATGPMTGVESGHGGMSPWTVRTTMILWGPDFKHGATVRAPSSNVDLVPTILWLKGIRASGTLDGRVLREAFRDGPDEEQVPYETRVLTTQAGPHYRAAIQITEIGGQRNLDKCWRIR
jgi:predicted AlkP superfamily pyrophosphatase or phosphodiesterase